MQRNRPKRKELLSLTRPQLKLVAVVCLPLILACLAVSFLEVYFFLGALRGRGALQGDFAREICHSALYITGIVLIVLVSVSFTVAVIVGHRIVGPMRRLARRLNALAAGQIHGGFHMRKGDDLSFVGEAVARMEESLGVRIEQCRKASARITEAVKRLEEGDAPGEVVPDLRKAADALCEQLNAFDLEETPAAAPQAPSPDDDDSAAILTE